MILKKTSAQMEAEAIQELLAGGQLTNMSSGSRVRAMIAAISKQNGGLMDVLDVNTAVGLATSSSGYFLDLIGSMVGVNREDAVAPYATKEDRAVKFYVNSGTLKVYIPGGSIPSSTTIQTSDGNIQYVVNEDVPFPDDATEVYVPVTANSTGSDYRVGKGLLTVHSLSNPNVLVVNEKGISNGGDQETDDNYRFRILNHQAIQATGNIIAVKLAALSTPGVADVVIKRHFQGPGTIDVLLIPIGNRISESTIVSAQALVNRVSSSGDWALVRGPKYVTISIDTRIDFTKDTPDSDKQGIRDTVRNAQIDYLDDIPLGGILVIQELRARTQEASTKILDHEILCLGINSRPQILRNYRLFEDELFLPDPEVDNPILVT